MKNSCQIIALILGTSLLFAASAIAGERSVSLKITVTAGKHSRSHTPVRAMVQVPVAWANQAVVTLNNSSGKRVSAQLVPPALLDDIPSATVTHRTMDLTWILPQLTAGQSANYSATIAPGETKSTAGFRWKDEPGKHRDLLLGDRRVVRYMYQAYEDDPEKRDLNNKPFHHLFDSTGKQLLTKGSGGHYTHHQGLYYGFTRCTFGNGKCNTWYCHAGEHELHKKFLSEIAGPVLARHRTAIDWNDLKGKPFCSEVRELTVFNLPGGTLVEWSSRLKSLKGTVTLSGDAQHAGFQYRAHNEVADKTKGQTYYLRPDGKDEPGKTRNPSRGQEVLDTKDTATKLVMNLPWKVMSFVVAGKRYSAEYIDSPKNPKPSFYSERDYGRFGSWFGKQELKQDGPPIEISYRIWLQDGEITAEQATALSSDFAEPPVAVVTVAE